MWPAERDRWARACTTAGWLSLVTWLAILAGQLDRARRTTSSRFPDGLWGQRIEQVSFAALPQNLVVLAPAVAAAVAASLLARPDVRDIWTDRLVRGAAGAAFVAAFLAAIGLVDAAVQDAELGAFVSRIGGLTLALAMIRLCLQVERERGEPDDQVPTSPSR